MCCCHCAHCCCLAASPSVSAEWVVTVKCKGTPTGSTLLTGTFAVSLTATLQVSTDCEATGTSSASLRVLTGCCKPGSAYAKGGLAGDPFSKALCFKTETDCKNSNWGWTNDLQGAFEGTYDLYSGSGNKDCQKGSYVGSVYVKCVNDGATSDVTLGPVVDDANCGGHPDHHYYIGCSKNPQCTPPAFGAPKLQARRARVRRDATAAKMYGGLAPANLMAFNGVPGTGMVRKMSCTCDQVWWVLHEAR
jgi:hypothetical protein